MKKLLIVFGLLLGPLALCIWAKPWWVQELRKTSVSSKILGPPKKPVEAKSLQGQEGCVYLPLRPASSQEHPNHPLVAIQGPKSETSIYPKTFVLVMEKGRVVGKNGVVITPFDDLIGGLFH